MSALATTLQAFFTDRLIRQRNASPHKIAAYRDTWRLLLSYATECTGVAPSALDLADLDATPIGGFLDHLETGRGNCIRTRNARLSTICSMFRYAALAHSEHAANIARVLTIGPKRFDRALISYLTEAEVDALLAACDQNTWTGRRDQAMFLLAVQAGLRVSELIRLCQINVHLGTGSHVACHGKGRRYQITPLTTSTAIVLRHTTAMWLLHAGVDTSAIALWLGHARVKTTQISLHADLELKEKALAKTKPPNIRSGQASRPTPCWLGSKDSNYADQASPEPLPRRGIGDHIGIMGDVPLRFMR